ncbi:MAG: Membrane protein involved in the export of O-antigen and teichoic acid [Candidatus Methanocomedens sp.]|nr:MAG: Membrane protein involved in the export of O-antigen and teichoic acid [ANME-2 cluster archaeon]
MFKPKTFFSRIMSIEPVRRQSIISFIWKIALTSIGFLSTMYFAHTVGAGVLGGYFLFMAYFGIINLVSDGGFGGAAIKRISEGEEQDAYFSAFFVLRSFFVTVVIVALLAFREHFVDLNNAGVFNWLLVALISSLLYGAVNNAIAGRGKIGIQATCGFIREITRILVQIIAVFLGYGVAGLAGGFVAGMIIASVIELRFFDLHLVRFGWRHVKSLSTFSFWLFLTSSGVMVYSYADTVMIGYYMSNPDVGVYRVVMQFTSIAALATTSLQATLWPRVSRWGKTGEIIQIEESLSRAITYALLLATPLCIGGILLGDKLLYYFYGADFAKGYPVLVVLFIVQIINVFQFFFLTYLSAMDQQKDAFKVTSVAAVANIVLNAVLIPVIGIAGAAIATFVTLLLNALLARRVLARRMAIVLGHESLLNILKASVVMGLFVGGYRMVVPLSNVWLALVPVVLGGVVYVVLVLKFDRKIYEELKEIMMQMNVT